MTAEGGKGEDGALDVLPFPPTVQTNYGPTEKAVDLGLETLPRGLRPLIKSSNGTVEVRFVASEVVSPFLLILFSFATALPLRIYPHISP